MDCRYMKTNGKQKILIIWLKKLNKKQKNIEEEMLQDMIEALQKHLRVM